jgi:cholesterol oxidase
LGESPSPDETEFDAVVVGSGFGGSVAALRLVEKGYRVAVVEMGRRYRAEDFARTSWDLRRFLWRPALGCHGIMQMTLLDDVFVLHGAGVGGGSLVYANTLLEPAPRVLDDPGWAGLDARRVLEPHYATARRMLGAALAPELYAGDRLLAEVAAEMGQVDGIRRAPVGVFFGEPGQTVPDPFFAGAGPPRTGCTRCGACMVGCRVGAKNTLDRNYLYLAEARGARVLPERKVTAIVALQDGGYQLSMRRSTGLWRGTHTLRARKVILAAGVLGTVPLLLRCKAAGLLPALSARLGTFVRTNSESLLAVRSGRDDVDMSHGIAIAGGTDIDDRTHVEVVRYNAGSDAMGLLGTLLTEGDSLWTRRLRWMANALLHPLATLRATIPFGWARRTAILLCMQPVDNHLRLRLGRRWWWPFTRALRSEKDTHKPIPVSFPRARELARRMATKVDGVAQANVLEVLFGVSSTAHILGGCPMGRSAEEGVIDTAGRVFGYEGLYVVDGSAVPANLGVNPSLTITALAEHMMSQIPPKASGAASEGAPAL